MKKGITLPKLVLPKRFEKLEQRAQALDTDLSKVIRRVDDATRRVEDLLRQARDGSVGRFELFVGKSGSGKTTFLKTLPLFFSGAKVIDIPKSVALPAVSEFVRSKTVLGQEPVIWVLFDRDNYRPNDDERRAFFEDLRVLFRTEAGECLIIWPITDRTAAQELAATAWDIGRDSLVDTMSRGAYDFVGIPRDTYYDVADVTTMTFNGGQSLEVFGLPRAATIEFARQSETIAEFYGHLEHESQSINRLYGDILRERIVPRVWILVVGDDNQSLDATVSRLTYGVENQVDINRLLAFIDDPDQESTYLKAWKEKRNQLAYIMRALDVRVIEVTPNVALAAARAFGEEGLTAGLNQQKVATTNAVLTIKNARFYRLLASPENARQAALRATDATTRAEYNRLQRAAQKKNKALNKALASALATAFQEDGLVFSVVAEKQELEGSALQPDILVIQNDTVSPICLEPTWRTTGTPADQDMNKQQNSLAPGRIQVYLLEKIMQYVIDLGL